MNVKRLARIAKETEALREILSRLQDILAEEEETFENMPESLQGSENGQRSEQAAATLTDATGNLENAIDDLEGIT